MFSAFTIKYTTLKKWLFWILAGTSVLSILLYAYFLNATVSHIVERKELQKDIATYNTQISELEFTYIQKQHEITLENARKLGFSEPDNPEYVTQGQVGPTLSLSRNQK
jgi:hypothetical protein